MVARDCLTQKTLLVDMKKRDLLLYLVTDSAMAAGRLTEIVQSAVESGVTMVQLREKSASFDEFCHKAQALKSICDKYNVPLIINDNIDVCLAVGASGVHLGSSDCDIATARKLLGKDKIIGGSARDIQTALKIQNDSADYLGVGAVFGTTTKSDAKAISVDILKNICQSVDIPVVAIGGVNEGNIELLKSSGIAGVAVVSCILKSENVQNTTKNLLTKLHKIV